MKLTAEDNLAPIRHQMSDLVTPKSEVIELGCGDGSLLFKLSPKIKWGLGIDQSKVMIDQASKQKERRQIINVDFLCETLGANFRHSPTYDFAIASLFFHVIPVPDAVYLLSKMKELAETILICGFTRAETRQQRMLLWLDQNFSGHYRNFKAYQKQGYLEGILAKTQCLNIVRYDTPIPFIKIYSISEVQNLG